MYTVVCFMSETNQKERRYVLGNARFLFYWVLVGRLMSVSSPRVRRRRTDVHQGCKYLATEMIRFDDDHLGSDTNATYLSRGQARTAAPESCCWFSAAPPVYYGNNVNELEPSEL